MDNKEINSKLVQAAQFSPNWIKEPFSWVGHLHFAHFLMNEVKPSTFVELGTHTGNSYFAFCQAVQELNLNTKTFAVDTWSGDIHSGAYDNEVFDQVEINNKNYSNFSTLLKMTFDEALNEFTDQSIDILHIDGLHTYEAVSHDFYTWLPKLNKNAIVLFHDTQVHDADFGVYKFWRELQEIYPANIELAQSNGLGILSISNDGRSNYLVWLIHSLAKANIKKYFYNLGSIFKKSTECDLMKSQLKKEIMYLNDEIKLNKIKNLTIEKLNGEIRNISAKRYDDITRADKLNIELKNIINSFSWKITLPLREAKRWANDPKNQAIRYLELFLHQKKIKLPKYLHLMILNIIQANRKIDNSHLLVAKERLKLLDLINNNCLFTALGNMNPEQIIEILLPGIIDSDLEKLVSSEPMVSIIIPVYAKLEFTLLLLNSIIKNPPIISFEIIIVDDFSNDHTFDTLSKIKGINLIRNIENKGFIFSCNSGADHAKGKYLHFLNNDTEVLMGWLDELAETFDNFPETGLAGSKLIYPDAKLQEAGGLVWKDGSAWNFGRLADPLEPQFNYAREVDYCSGASIMIPRDLFKKFNGFDSCYSPAYYEDVDIAFKLRSEGYRVIYQPLSVVIHHEGISSGTDLTQGVKSYQDINKVKFIERWSHVLSRYNSNGVDPDSSKDRRKDKRILIIDNNTVTPDQDAGSLLIFNICLLLRELNFQVTFAASSALVEVPRHTARLQKMGIEVIYAPYVSSLESHLKEYGQRYQLAMVIRPDNALINIDLIRKNCSNTKIIYHTIDLHHLRMLREGILTHSDAIVSNSHKMKKLELEIIYKSDLTIVVSQEERIAILKEYPDLNIKTLGLVLAQSHEKFNSIRERNGIIFVGGFSHAPNVDAVLFFIKEVMPELLKFHPNLLLTIVGSNIPPELFEYQNQNINFLGYIKDLNSILNDSLVNIAPLRFGAGLKGKIANALSLGLPTVASSIAVEGMGLTNNENVIIADQPHEYIKAIDTLIRDKAIWNKISSKSLQYANSRWSGQVMVKELSDVISSLDIKSKPGRYPIILYEDRLA